MGFDKQCFYQKHAKDTDPPAVRRITIDEDGESATWMMIEDLAGLISLVQMGTLELHVWGSRHARLEHPDRVIFDLDPDPGLAWSRLAEGARFLRDQLAAIGLTSFVKTTGGKGLHVVVPIEPAHTYDEVKEFTKVVAEAIAGARPAQYTSVMAKAARKGRIFIDYLRNGRGATAVAAWSTRARAGAPISTPVRWDELGTDLREGRFNAQNVRRRLAALGADPWEGFFTTRQRLPLGPRTRGARAASGRSRPS
jgi:bifunctional non-homologous end joining protein LigD